MTTAPAETPTLTHDGLAAELLKRRRKRLPALTAALALAVAITAGIILGVEAQKHWGAVRTTSRAAPGVPSGFAAVGGAGFPGGASGFGGRAGAGGTANAGGSGTNGTITLIKGSTLYVTDASGNTVLVHTSARSRVSKTASGTVKTIHPGDTVTVVGTHNKDGSYSARQVTIGTGTSG